MLSEQRSELKTGRRPVQLATKVYNKGDPLFMEGSVGKELFIIQDGLVGVFRDSQEGPIELAKVGKNGIVGEMSLLDDQPRSATVRAIEKTTVVAVNDRMFDAAMEAVPGWLTSIVKIIVSRLRDTNKRVDQSALRDRERGVVSLLLLLLEEGSYTFGSLPALQYEAMLVEAFFVSGLRRKETEIILNNLDKRGVVEIAEDTDHVKHIRFKDMEIMRLYHEYLTLKSQKKRFREMDISDEAIAVLSNIAYVAQKSGTESPDGTLLNKSHFFGDFQEKEQQHLEQILMDLRKKGIINIVFREKEQCLCFKSESISRIKKIREWLPKFEAEIV